MDRLNKNSINYEDLKDFFTNGLNISMYDESVDSFIVFDSNWGSRDMPSSDEECKHERAYKNVISKNVSFWVCPDCCIEVPPPIGKN
jgi:hypothetical protein